VVIEMKYLKWIVGGGMFAAIVALQPAAHAWTLSVLWNPNTPPSCAPAGTKLAHAEGYKNDNGWITDCCAVSTYGNTQTTGCSSTCDRTVVDVKNNGVYVGSTQGTPGTAALYEWYCAGHTGDINYWIGTGSCW